MSCRTSIHIDDSWRTPSDCLLRSRPVVRPTTHKESADTDTVGVYVVISCHILPTSSTVISSGENVPLYGINLPTDVSFETHIE